MIERLEKLYSAVVCDVLDQLGFRNQALPAQIRPLTPSVHVSGRIRTARAETVTTIPEKPYELEIASVDALQSGDFELPPMVVVAKGHAVFVGDLVGCIDAFAGHFDHVS